MVALLLQYLHAAWATVLFFASPLSIAGAALVVLVCLGLRIYLGNIGGWAVRTLVYAGIYVAIVTHEQFRVLFEAATTPIDHSGGFAGTLRQIVAALHSGQYAAYGTAAVLLIVLWLPVTIVGGLIRRRRVGGRAPAYAPASPHAAGAASRPPIAQGRRDAGERKQVVTIMMTDIAGYSARMEKDEAATFTLLKEHNVIMRKNIGSHRGREIKTIGDAFMVVFNDPLDALRCGIAMQKDIHAFNKPRPANDQLRVRIGIHQGEVIVTPKDVFGEGVNIAARMESITEPGGLSISADIYDAVKNKVEAGFQNIGIPKMKNIANPPTVYRVHVAHQ